MFRLFKVSELKTTEAISVFILKSVEDRVSQLRTQRFYDYFMKKVNSGSDIVHIQEINTVFILSGKITKEHYLTKEYFRKKGFDILNILREENLKEVAIYGTDAESVIDLTEGLALSTYRFDKYKSKATKAEVINIYVDQAPTKDLLMLSNLIDAVNICKDWVNEPVIHLTAEQFAVEMQEKFKGINHTKVDVMNKQKIESLKMGGLLAINLGSPNPPTFTIIEYTHPNASSKKPIALIGKGVVFDTGGLSLKETTGSMDIMKCDMAGAASIAATIYALAQNDIPLNIIGLIPATENRPSGNAIVPSDIITMYNGKTVEILNTDAEGRVILGDAMAYAEKYDPELVIDLATLTGAAIAAIGKEAAVLIGTADSLTKQRLTTAGFNTYERLVEFPLWAEYEKEIESEIADIKNIGSGKGAGAITAAAFLKHFTTKPWIHIDIAGPSFISGTDSYRGKNATGYGVRLLYEFLTNNLNK